MIYWKGKIKPRRFDQLVTSRELAPTFLEAAGIVPEKEVGPGLLSLLLKGQDNVDHSAAFFERERHSNSRQGDLGYPARAIRTNDFLYIRNFHSERWPAGDPKHYFSVGPYGDVDASPTKDFLIQNRDSLLVAMHFLLAMAKRPSEELYDLKKDPAQLHSVVYHKDYQRQRLTLNNHLTVWMKETQDPRADVNDDRWDRYPYFGKKVE